MTTIAIVDDDPQAAESVRYAVEDAGFDPWVFPGKGQSLQWAMAQIQEHANGAVCDHRLSRLGFASFTGAELAARLIEARLPTVLISQFVNQDYDVSIRRWRAGVPSVLSRDDCRAETLKGALELCRREIQGEIVCERRKHRTLLRVMDTQSEGGESVIDAIIPAWNRSVAVRFPIGIVPVHLHPQLEKGAYLIAYINLAATRSEELYLRDFEAPTPLDEATS